MTDRTNAIVLRVYPYSRTSHVVIWLSPGLGRLVTLVKGALRPKSRFLGQYDLFYTCELVYYTRERNGVHILKECSPLQYRPGLRERWRSAMAASYAVDLANRTSVPGPDHHGLFELTGHLLDYLDLNPPTSALLSWFEIRWMGQLGWAPQLAVCTTCNKDLTTPSVAWFTPAWGGLKCPACAGHANPDDTWHLTPDLLAILRSWQNTPHPDTPAKTFCHPTQVLALQAFLGTILDYHLDLQTESRSMVMDLLKPERNRRMEQPCVEP